MMEKRVADMGLGYRPRLKPICALLLTIIAGWQAEAWADKDLSLIHI